MKKVIINADDFGYSSGVNQGILKAHKDGLLTSTTLMANMPGSLEAIKMAHENKNLGIGCHLVLTCGRPLTYAKTIANEYGVFYSLKEYKKYRSNMDDEDIYSEWCHQIDFLLNHGIELTHIDSHHHVHTFKENLEITRTISEKYGLVFRNAFELEENCILPYQKGIKGFLDLMDYPNIRDLTLSFSSNKDECIKELQKVLDQIKDNEITELMVHPAFVDEVLYFNSSFNIGRIKEVSILCDIEVEKLFQNNHIDLYHYGNI